MKKYFGLGVYLEGKLLEGGKKSLKQLGVKADSVLELAYLSLDGVIGV